MKVSHQRSALSLVELLVVIAIVGVLLAILVPAVQRVRAAAAQRACASNLRQIGCALHHYHDSFETLPPGNSPPNGKSRYWYMGWHARILPYVEGDNLWRETERAFRSDAAFFHNPPHVGLGTVMKVYGCPTDSRVAVAQRNKVGTGIALTSYLGVAGTNYQAKDGLLFGDSAIRFAEVGDGMTNTIIVGERPPRPDFELGWWYAGVGQDGAGSCDMLLGASEIYRYGPGICPRGPYSFAPGRLDDMCDAYHFWSLHSDGANFLFGDGGVRFLRYSAAPILPALATRSGGESVVLPD
jgi:prepilin-type N-terminal cleavage/methylation domain-containing protein/prepilin-type processing-associated H-X9-DG protein